MNALRQTGSKASINHKSFLVSYAPALMFQGTKFAVTSAITSIGKLSFDSE
jgi:hypothetical protein